MASGAADHKARQRVKKYAVLSYASAVDISEIPHRPRRPNDQGGIASDGQVGRVINRPESAVAHSELSRRRTAGIDEGADDS